MIVEQKKTVTFHPVTVTFETEAEAALFQAFVGPATGVHMTEALEHHGYSPEEAQDAANSYYAAFCELGYFVNPPHDRYFTKPVTDY